MLRIGQDLAQAIVDRVLERGRLHILDGPSLREPTDGNQAMEGHGIPCLSTFGAEPPIR